MAEEVGFEPTDAFTSHAFEACSEMSLTRQNTRDRPVHRASIARRRSRRIRPPRRIEDPAGRQVPATFPRGRFGASTDAGTYSYLDGSVRDRGQCPPASCSQRRVGRPTPTNVGDAKVRWCHVQFTTGCVAEALVPAVRFG